ncbi:acyl-CoA dehydrogenase family protein [Sphingomonas sp. ST-64]|uniref:Acyl-CoA dehydrogenase family protein n=1 Tax=Sphingomonas plantiphila TaxID=3163295 RepID=A0ABW8YRJ4_9SPHN
MSAIDYDAFREEVRAFALRACPADIRETVAANRKIGRAEWSRWQRILYDHGWGAPSWPVEHGGTGWDVRQRFIFDEVTAECECPPQYHHGLRHLGPVLIEYGSQEQKERFLPPILTGGQWWCQGYSEPGAGSDLAALKTRAVLDDGEYVVTGQKLWTSHAHEADMMYTLVRSGDGARKQDGITMLLIPLDSAGVTVREVRTIDGWHHVNEVFLEDVRVPVANRIGQDGQGWEIGKFLLDRERLGSANTAPLTQYLRRTRALVRDALPGRDNEVRRRALEMRLAQCEAELAGQRELGRRAVATVAAGQPLRLQPSVLKAASSRIQQRVSEIALEVQGAVAASRYSTTGNEAVDGVEWVQNYMFHRARTILGGSNEVQKNVIARDLFGS